MSVIMEKVSPCAARENYAAILNEVAPKKLEDVVAGLEAKFASMPRAEISQCDVCLGWSDSALPACPFCNVGEDGATATPPEAPVPVAIVQAPKQRASAPSLMLAGGSVTYTEKDLDESIGRLRAAAGKTSDYSYEMGRELTLIRAHLWEQRKDAEGKPKYKSYREFLEQELDIGEGYANKLRRISELFTLEQYREFGVRALMALIAAPTQVHAMLLQKRREGATIEQLEVDVREARASTGTRVIETEATRDAAAKGRTIPSPEATASGAKKRTKEAAAITIGLKAPEFTVDLLARPKNKNDEARPARTVEDQPYAEVECLNGTKLYFAVKQTPAGNLKLKVTAKRKDDL